MNYRYNMQIVKQITGGWVEQMLSFYVFIFGNNQ